MVKILSKFSSTEWEKFNAYIDGNGAPQIMKLSKLLYKARSKESLSKVQIIKKMPNFEGRLDDLMNRLLNHVVDFIYATYPNLHTEIQKAERLLAFFSERDLPDEYASWSCRPVQRLHYL